MSAEEQEGHWLINELLGGHKRAVWNMLGTGDAQTIYIFHPYLLPPISCYDGLAPSVMHFFLHPFKFPGMRVDFFVWKLDKATGGVFETPPAVSHLVLEAPLLFSHPLARPGQEQLSHPCSALVSSTVAGMKRRIFIDTHPCWAPSGSKTPGEMQCSTLVLLATGSPGPIWHLV